MIDLDSDLTEERAIGNALRRGRHPCQEGARDP